MALRAPEVAGSSPPTLSIPEQHSHTPQWFWNDTPHWYIIQTKPHEEERVIAHLGLRSQMIEPFLPKIEIVRKRAGRRATTLEPLFPNYLFLQMSLTPATWNAVRWAPGTRRILGDGERPVAVPIEVVQTIHDRVELLGFVRVGMDLTQGTRVRVKAGPFAGLEGIFERPTSRRDRVRVLLEILGSVRPLEIEIFDLERV